MSSKTIMICDICGKEISDDNCYYNLGINKIAGSLGVILAKSGDYCEDCYKDIITELYNNIKTEESVPEDNTGNTENM